MTGGADGPGTAEGTGDAPGSPPHVLIACFPKSASTYLTALVGALPNFERVSLVPGFGRREQELDEQLLRARDGSRWVAQHHVRRHKVTGDYMARYGITPVVLVRDIHDVVVSLLDHSRDVSVLWPMVHMRKSMLTWDDDRLLEFLVDMAVPWYINFYVSWTATRPPLLLTYDEVVAAPADALGRIVTEIGLDTEGLDIAALAASVGARRLNVGVSGRGAERLPPNLIARIRRMSEYYPGVDFGPMGIESP